MSDFRANALVCENGHLVTGDIRANPGDVAKFCSRCGEPVYDSCPNCNSEIPGDHYYAEAWTGDLSPEYQIPEAPRYCEDCGNPFPWTQSALEAAVELADELQLDTEDKEELKASLPELVRDTPKTQVAIAKFSRLMGKAGKEGLSLMQGILASVVTEAVKKALWP